MKEAPRPSEGELFKKILGSTWNQLHPDIRRRFDQNPLPGKPLSYRGTLSELRCSLPGRLLAYLTMPMIKGALMPYNDADFPVDIEVYSKAGDPAIYKQRTYRLNGRKSVMFTSFMRESSRGEVLEYVGMGLGMKLVLDVREGNLHFDSDGYFWEVFGKRFPIPDLLSPGRTTLYHRNRSPGEFAIRIEIRHAVFGLMFTQAGVFREIRQALPIRLVRFPDETAALRALIGEYIAWLGIDLGYQSVDSELEQLASVYGGQNGFMLVATDGDQLAGCVGMKWRGDGVGEMKRLYLRPAYQGHGTGAALIDAVLAHAAKEGARRVVLDTAPGTETAQERYRRAGFRECAPYYDSPLAGTKYFSYEIGNVDRHVR